MSEIMQHIVFGGGLTVFLAAIVSVPYIIGYTQGRANTLANLWLKEDDE